MLNGTCVPRYCHLSFAHSIKLYHPCYFRKPTILIIEVNTKILFFFSFKCVRTMKKSVFFFCLYFVWNTKPKEQKTKKCVLMHQQSATKAHFKNDQAD